MKLEKITARGAEGLYRESETKIIYLRKFRKGSGEIKISLRTTVLEDAKKRRDEQLKNAGFKKGKDARKTALEVFDEWVERKRSQDKSKATVTSISSTRNFLEEFFSDMFPPEITERWWESEFIPKTKFVRWHAVRDKETKTWSRTKRARSKPRKFFNDWKWTQAFIDQCVKDGLIPKDSRPTLINPDPPRAPGKVYTDDEIQDLLNMCPNEDLYLAILMSVTMGMRRGEIFQLKSDRVDVGKGVIRLRAEDTKIRKARAFAISQATKDLIITRAKAGPWIFRSKDSPLVPLHKDGFTTAWTNLKKNTGVEGRFHYLRHTFLTKAFKTPGANAALICHYAGLSLQVAQKVYLHFDDEDTRHVAGLVQYAV